MEQHRHSSQQSIEIENFWLKHLLATKHEELPSELSGPFPGLPDLLDGLVHRIIWLELDKNQRRITEDDGKYIVEVVSDAAGQPPHGFHFLRLPELLLCLAKCAFCSHASGLLLLCLGRQLRVLLLCLLALREVRHEGNALRVFQGRDADQNRNSATVLA